MMVAMTHPTANTAVDCQNPLAVGSTMREKAMSSPMKIRRICQINPCRVSVFYVIEKKLFVDLGKCQKNTAGKEQMQTERFGARPQFPCGKGGERDADQHKY